MKAKKQISLLSNEPCREDAFEGHSHQIIAAQIARLIKEDEQRHIIGIEGGWGSGKSNLISLVNKGLNGNNVYDKEFDHKSTPYPFFVYDAWGHQADFQRRAILEELTQELTYEKKILDGKKWRRKLEELLAKRKKTTTKEVPRLGIGVVVSAILCFLTPLIVYLVNLVPLEKWWLRLLIAVIPYLGGLIGVIIDRRKSLKKNGQDRSFANICAELLLVYKDQIKENETYTTISEKEPSSSEFKAWMDEVDKDLKTLNKTLVIVFDNMDRLPSQKVENLWSSIHSFFSDKTYDNIKVLIPFDRQHVKKAFKNEDIIDAKGAKDSKEESYGNDFIDKTFDVVFRVPPPIMSGWQHYMEDLWKRAFGSDAELSISVTQIYDALSKRHTPRKIIAFVNEMATVKMTMDDDIPDKYIALFIFGKEAIEKDPIGQLLNPDYMGEVKFEFENDPDAIKYLSAIYYQLPADQAQDVIFTKEATEALNSGNAERLHEMMVHMDLPPILGNAILKVTEVEKATIALAKLDEYYGYSDYDELPAWLKQIWKSLYQKCRSMGLEWNEIKEFHVPLFTHLYDDSLAEDLISGYLSISDNKWNAERYVETINRLRENNDIIDHKLGQHKRKLTPKLFLELLNYTGDNFEDYGVTYDIGELDNYLAGLEQNDVVSLTVIPSTGIEKNQLPNYKAKLQEWLGDSRDLTTSQIETLFERLKEISDKPIAFDEFFDDSNISEAWSEMESSDSSFKYDLVAMRVARMDNMSSSYSDSFQTFLENFEETDAEKLADVIEYYITYDRLLVNSENLRGYPLVVKTVELLTEKSRGVSSVHVMQCLTHYDQTVSDYNLDGEKLFYRLEGWLQFIDFKQTKVEKLPSGLIRVAGEIDNKLSKTIHAACEEHYAAQTQDQWKDHILKKDNTYRIWKLYHPQKYQANFDALKAVLKDYASGTSSAQPNKNTINEWLTVCLELKHPVKGLFNDISSILKRGMINKVKLLYFGKYILEYADAEKQNDFVVKLIPTEIIDAEVIEFVYENIERLKACEIPDDFKEKVRHLAETSMKDDERIVTVCQGIGVVLSQPEEKHVS